VNKFEEIASEFKALICVQPEVLEVKCLGKMSQCFHELSRTEPSMLIPRMKQHSYDVLFIDKDVALDNNLKVSIETLKRDFPRTVIFIESGDSDAERILEIIQLNVDKTILSSLSNDEFCGQLEHSLFPQYELQLNARYEKHLGDLIFGKTQELELQQNNDPLTGFQNATALKQSFNDSSYKGILYLDIDKFDTINTLYGMKTGDEVLKSVSRRLAKYLPENCNIFRVSADEFVILIYEPKTQQLQHLADQIITMFSETAIVIDETEFEIYFSIGIHEGSDYDICYDAKLANREAKYLGGKTSIKFNDDSRFLNMQKENHFWINEIKHALDDDRIIVYYQPIFDTKTRHIDKYEALVRLETITGDVITPNFFLKAAILSELITTVSRVVIDQTFKKFSQNDHSFSFNLSDQDFKEGYLEDFLKYKCEYYKIDPSRVYIEILEETSLNCSEDFLDQINSLKKAGFKFSIDDFGIEKSNFSRVLELEAEIIKIDGSFVKNLDHNEHSSIIVDSIVDFAQKIGAKTVAEFVETEEVLTILQDKGVDYAQGYLIGKPSPNLMCNLR
jgi:diguanylate cyclase (GGDEF)-like protein